MNNHLLRKSACLQLSNMEKYNNDMLSQFYFSAGFRESENLFLSKQR